MSTRQLLDRIAPVKRMPTSTLVYAVDKRTAPLSRTAPVDRAIVRATQTVGTATWLRRLHD